MSCSLVPYSKGRRGIERCVALISPYFSDQWGKNMVCFIPYRSIDNTVHSPILICTDIRHKVFSCGHDISFVFMYGYLHWIIEHHVLSGQFQQHRIIKEFIDTHIFT
jgi:hypothetical protein